MPGVLVSLHAISGTISLCVSSAAENQTALRYAQPHRQVGEEVAAGEETGVEPGGFLAK